MKRTFSNETVFLRQRLSAKAIMTIGARPNETV
jgi:hypothetical protein